MANELQTTEVPGALEPWEEELYTQAQAAAAQEASTGGGQFFSLRGGRLMLAGAQLPDNQMAVLVLDALLVNAYYSGPFDPDAPQVPDCYAFGRDETTLAPHALVKAPQCATCAACPFNQFGSLVVDGKPRRGKACRNTRRLGLIPGGTLEPGSGRFTPYLTVDEIITAPLAYLTVPPTSVGAFGNYTKQLTGALKRPPRAVYTKIEVQPDPRHQIKVVFTALGPVQVPGPLWEAIKTRTKEVEAVIGFGFQASGGDADGAEGKEARGGTTKSSGAKKRKY
jgi:hypothetical protein